jgi:hypothetical protein
MTNTRTQLLCATIVCAGSLNGAQADDRIAQLSAQSQTWDRPSATNAVITGSCDASTQDSLNDEVAYELFYIRASTFTASLDIQVDSLEPTPLDLDPFIAIYCTNFNPAMPNENLLFVDDDSAGYPNALAFHSAILDPDSLYIAVVSSYSNYAPSQYGEFQITIAPDLYFSTQCIPDYTGNGTLNFFDISIFLSLYTALDPAADLNHDGTFNFFDISAFLTAFAAGCP